MGVMAVWEHAGQLYEVSSMFDLTRDGRLYELVALRGQPGDGPEIYVFVPEGDSAAATISWYGSVQSMPLSVLRRFLSFVEDEETPLGDVGHD